MVGEPQARYLTIEDESFRFFQLDDSPAQPFHEGYSQARPSLSSPGILGPPKFHSLKHL